MKNKLHHRDSKVVGWNKGRNPQINFVPFYQVHSKEHIKSSKSIFSNHFKQKKSIKKNTPLV